MAIKFKYAECSVGPVHGPRQFPDGVNLFRQGRIDIKSRSVLPIHGATQVSQLQLTLSMSSKCTLNAYSSIPDNVGAIGSEFAYHALDLYCSIRLAIIPKLRSVIRAHICVYTYVEFASTHAVTGKAGKKLTLSRGSQVDSSCGNPFHLTRTDQEPLTFVFFTLHKHNHARAIAIVNEVRTRRIAQLYSSLLHVGRRCSKCSRSSSRRRRATSRSVALSGSAFFARILPRGGLEAAVHVGTPGSRLQLVGPSHPIMIMNMGGGQGHVHAC